MTATSQCLRAFTVCGFPPDYLVSERAIRWLCDANHAGTLNHPFWRLAALSELRSSLIPPTIVDGDFAALRSLIDSGAGIDARLNYRAYLLDCIVNTGTRPAWLHSYIADEAAYLAQHADDPTPLLWGYAALEKLGAVSSVAVDSTKIAAALRRQGASYQLNGSVVETSYFVLNCCRSDDLSRDPVLKPVLDGAVTWILSRQDGRSGTWPAESPPYSGDPQSQAYFTAVPVRALATYLKRFRPERAVEIALPDWILRRRLAKTLRWALLVTGLGLSLIAFGLIVPFTWGRISTAVGVIASIAGIVSFVWDAQTKLRAR